MMSDGRLPLEGIRVLELAQIVAGPFCGALMAEFGAEVIKVEMPGRGDDIRRMGPAEQNVGYWWAVDNRNKQVMTLDLHHPKGQEIVRRLVPLVDVVTENFRPSTLERWHVGWEDLSGINPRLVMARITTFGQTGPWRNGPGFAAIGSAFGGTWYINGPADRPPSRPTPVYPDYMTGLFTAFGVLAALRHRDATGEGQWIDAALYESTFRTLEHTAAWYGRQGVVRERGGLQHIGWPGGACQTQDGRWVAYTAPAQHLFERVCKMLGQPDLPQDERYATPEAEDAFFARLYDRIGALPGAVAVGGFGNLPLRGGSSIPRRAAPGTRRSGGGTRSPGKAPELRPHLPACQPADPSRGGRGHSVRTSVSAGAPPPPASRG